ncbi:MAG: bifunctional DNA-formamidopyrimidine glycosylase/DNA-(apurinic or apyrimidinic site) lyase [Rhodovulum sp.]|nr:bifunctional DNA-formamidopyrimidine glycosylase/DNA-(apurinic or apyrimidinic site) lyase [Rhodovulum sp.]
MPELPEVETVRRGLAPVMEGATIRAVELRRPDLRRPFPNDFRLRLEGATVTALRRRAKYLLADLSTGDVVLMHLGMSGSFRIERPAGAAAVPGAYYHARSEDLAHDHVVLAMSSGARVVFNDPRRFGLMLVVAADELDAHPLLRAVGPEPLDPGFDAAKLAAALAGKAAPLKAALLDQTVVAGLGNIYVCEALHLARLSPRRRAGTLVGRGGVPTPRAVALVEAIKMVLADAITAGGSSLRDHRQTDGTLGLFQHRFRVYDREDAPCVTPGCGGVVRRIVQSGRSTFFCTMCQK